MHEHTPSVPRGFTVVPGDFRQSRGVLAIERVDGATIVTLVPGDGDERSEGKASVRLLLTGPGVGEIDDSHEPVPDWKQKQIDKKAARLKEKR